MIVIVASAQGSAAGGSDVTPDALNWGNIAVTGVGGYETNAATVQTLAGIDALITLNAAWTSSSASPARGQWIKNGAAVQAPSASPVTVTAKVGDQLYFAVYAAYTFPSGNYDTGTVTVTNLTDGGAAIDTFTFAVQYVYSGGGGTGGGDGEDYLEP